MALFSLSRCVRACLLYVGDPSPDSQSTRPLPNALRLKALTRNVLLPAQMGPRIIWDLVEARTRPLKPFCFVPAETKIHIRGTVQSARFWWKPSPCQTTQSIFRALYLVSEVKKKYLRNWFSQAPRCFIYFMWRTVTCECTCSSTCTQARLEYFYFKGLYSSLNYRLFLQ